MSPHFDDLLLKHKESNVHLKFGGLTYFRFHSNTFSEELIGKIGSTKLVMMSL